MKRILKSVLKNGQEFPGKQTNDYGKIDILFQIKNALWLFFTISLRPEIKKQITLGFS